MTEKFLRLFYRDDWIGKTTRTFAIILLFLVVATSLMRQGDRIRASQSNPQTADYYY